MDSSNNGSNNDSNNDYVNQSEMSNPGLENEELPTVTDRNVSEHGHGFFLQQNIHRRLENGMPKHVWDFLSSSSYFHEGESSRQAEQRTSSALNGNGNENDVGNMNLNPSLISDTSSWNGYNQRLMDISSMVHLPEFEPINGAPGTLHPRAGDNIPDRVEDSTAAAAAPGFVPMPMGPLTGSQHEEMDLEDYLILNFESDSSDDDEEPDAHGDMHMDVEAMSYEELLDLGDNIGTVGTGFSVNDISAHVTKKTYKSLKLEPPTGDDLCSICREDYDDEDVLGVLDCKHEFHYECIKQWLVLKNVCPICKRSV